MIDMAIRAELPLISVHTDDTINVGTVLNELTGNKVLQTTPDAINTKKAGLQVSKFFYMISPEVNSYEQLYKNCVEKDFVVIIVNPIEPNSIMFDAGVLTVSNRMVGAFLKNMVMKELLPDVVNALAGLSLKDIGEIVKICMSEYHDLAPEHLIDIRRRVTRTILGLQQIDTDITGYVLDDTLEDWTKVDGELFMMPDVPKELIPRGLLFDGDPGTGKTFGAKYISHAMGVPLFRLNLGPMLNKYLGQSEGNFERALSMATRNSPCVLLIDETEKLFNGSDDSGVSSKLLSQLLWWLQEHKGRVLTIMTTNDKGSLPPELYRPGRIDKVITFKGVAGPDTVDFVREYFHQHLSNVTNITLKDSDIGQILSGHKHESYISQAELVQLVHDFVKKKMVAEPLY